MYPVLKNTVSADTMRAGFLPALDVRSESIQTKLFTVILGLILIITSLSYFVFEPATLKWLSREDGPVENISAFNWLLAAAAMFVLFARKRNIWFLLLAIFFTVCLGEEISWGQRIFGFATPESIEFNNVQGEFNLHNMNIFDRRASDGGFWTAMHDITRLFAIIWFLYGIVLPVTLKLSAPLRRFAERIRLPLMPLTIGLLFLANYLVFQYFEDVHKLVCARVGMVNNANVSSLPVELREWYASLLYLVFSLNLLRHNRSASRGLLFNKRDEVIFSSRPGLELLNFRRKT